MFRKAEESTLKYTEGQIKEQIEMAVFNSMINSTGDIVLEELEKGLLEINGVTEDGIEKQGENEKLPWIVTVEEWKFEIDENGKVEVIKGISIPKSLKIVEGTTETITATLMSGITGKISWKIEDDNIGKLSSTTGNRIEVVAQATNGSTIIIASVITENGVTYSSECVLTIIQKVTAITVKDLKIHTGGTGKIVVERQPKDVEVEDFKYESKNPEIATVDENGVVTGLKEGTAKIVVTGKISGISGEGNVQVAGLAVGDCVIYNVNYRDMYDSKKFYDNSGSGKYGWRILDLGEYDETTRNSFRS